MAFIRYGPKERAIVLASDILLKFELSVAVFVSFLLLFYWNHCELGDDCMQGIVLDFSIPKNQGIILGDDNQRYRFTGADWMSPSSPQGRIDFVARDGHAEEIYALAELASRSAPNTLGFYRSSDQAMIGGVCAGLAHKWGISLLAVRILMLILIYGIPIYLLAWIMLPERPTKLNAAGQIVAR